VPWLRERGGGRGLMARDGVSWWYERDVASPGESKEHHRAAAALRALRAESRKDERKPYRAASLAEAEATAGLYEREGETSAALLREHGLIGKHKRVSRGARAETVDS